MADQLSLNASLITLSCRYAVSTTGQAFLRRFLQRMWPTWVAPLPESLTPTAAEAIDSFVQRQSSNARSSSVPEARRLQEGGAAATGDAKLEVQLTIPGGTDTAQTASTGCAAVAGASSSVNLCEPDKRVAALKYTIEQLKPESQAGTACSTATSAGTAALRASGASTNDIIPVACSLKMLAATAEGGIGGPDGGNSGPGGNGTTLGASPSGGGGDSGLSQGAIAGIVIGAVGGTVVLAVVGLAVKNKIAQRGSVHYVDTANFRHEVDVAAAPDGGATAPPRGGRMRWLTYSMQQRQEAAMSGRGPVAGVSHYA